MDDDTLIDYLEELAERFGIQIRYEAIKQDEDSTYGVGGLCLLKGEYVLIINSKATMKDRIRNRGMRLIQNLTLNPSHLGRVRQG